MYHNIEKSAFRKGEYVGYADGPWHITKSTSSYGSWCARKASDENEQVFAFGLKALPDKLAAIAARKAA